MICSPRCIDAPGMNKKRISHCVWSPPVEGQIKVNVDGSFFGGVGREGIGDIFRNLDGKVLLQSCKKLLVELAVYVELLALREGLLVTDVSR